MNKNDTKTKKQKCCICGTEIKGYGNNPDPLSRGGRCCDACNYYVVLARSVLYDLYKRAKSIAS